MTWLLKVCEPSGETRMIPLKGRTTIGRSPESQVILRDSQAPSNAAIIWPSAAPDETRNSFWIKAHESCAPVQVGDLKVREAHLPVGIPCKIAETQFSLETQKEAIHIPTYPQGIPPWLTCSDAGGKVLWTAKKTAQTPLSIYLEGETGTGKEVLAHLIHAWSERRAGPFIAINCGALPLSIVESELFGHVKGAFTGALQHRPGAFRQAHGGTLFLDEIGDLPLDIQVKLLRFLENGEVRPVGSDQSCRADVRLLSATHHPLQKWIDEGKFRKDLYYRIASVTLPIPSLRERPQDVELLARRFASALGKSIGPQAILRLQAHSWPGNVRELKHAIERASGLASASNYVLGEESFDFLLTPDHILESPNLAFGTPVLSLHEMEKALLLRTLKMTQGNRARAAKILGVARSTLFEMIKRHGVIGPRSAHL